MKLPGQKENLIVIKMQFMRNNVTLKRKNTVPIAVNHWLWYGTSMSEQVDSVVGLQGNTANLSRVH